MTAQELADVIDQLPRVPCAALNRVNSPRQPAVSPDEGGHVLNGSRRWQTIINPYWKPTRASLW
jgi:hypothetical protein